MRTSYEIRDASGRLVAYHVRRDTVDGKKVWWELPDGSTGLNGTRLEELPLYGADLVSDAGADEFIVVCEGEKARDALERLKIPAVGTVTGAAGTPGPEALEVLRDRRVCLWPDNDDVGRAHMARIGQLLQSIAAEVRIFTWHDAEVEGADAADHYAVKSGHSKAIDRLWTDLENSPLFEPELRADPGLPVGRLLSEVKAERVDWLWCGRIPKGKLTIIEGDPGLGKSALTTDLASRVSAGRPWPDGSPCEPGGVVLLNAEDGLADTVRPRLDAAGGDAERVLALATVPGGDSERMLFIPEDLGIIRRGIERVKAGLVVIDPLMAFLSAEVNSHRDQDVRRALAPLGALGEETGAAILVVRHLNKANGGNPLYRGGGSVGIVGAARSALLVAEHPEDDDLRVLARVKGNLAKPLPSIAFTITEAANGAVRVEWKGETNHTAAALLAAPTDPEERSALDEAKEFLRDALANEPVWSKQVEKEAREAGITEITLKRAKRALGVRSQKQEGDGSWAWALPDGNYQPHTSQDDPLDRLDPLPIDTPGSRQRGGKQGEHDDPLGPSSGARMNKQVTRSEGEQDAQGDQGDHGSISRARRLSAGEVHEVRKLVREGMSPEWARAEVLSQPQPRLVSAMRDRGEGRT